MTAIKEALQELEDVLNCEGFGCACTPMGKCATCKARDVMASAWPAFRRLRAALSQEVPQESVPAGYVLVDLNEYDGDDPRADADTDRWMAAADAFVKANPHNMRGLAEWECQMRAAIEVLAAPQVKVAAQEPQNPEFAECGVCHGYYSRCVMPCPYSGAPTQEPAGEPAELAEFRAWKVDRDEQARTRGRYCLTPEGRAEVRRIFDADDWVFVLLDEVERLEAAIDALAAARKGKK